MGGAAFLKDISDNKRHLETVTGIKQVYNFIRAGDNLTHSI